MVIFSLILRCDCDFFLCIKMNEFHVCETGVNVGLIKLCIQIIVAG